jgi:hypothetical protein
MGIRASLRLLAGALAASAALLFLQTFILRAVPYDSPAFGVFVALFRASFMAADVVALVTLLLLGRRHPALYPFTSLAIVHLGITLVASGIGWIISASDGSHRGAALGTIEPMLSFGATILVALALAAVLPASAPPDRRRTIAFATAIAAALGVLFLRIALSFDRDPTNMAFAWLRFALAIVPPASLAALALLVAPSRELPDPALDPALAGGGGGYRAAGEGAANIARPELAVPGAATIAPLRMAASGLKLHRTAFITRVVVAAVAVVALLLPLGALGAVAFPFVGAATAIAIVIGLARQRRLATFHGGAALVGAMVTFGLSGLLDLGAILWTAIAFAVGSYTSSGFVALPLATFFGGIGILLVSRAHERAGDLLYKFRLAGLSRWTQGLVVLTASSGLAFFAVVSRADRHSGRGDGDVVVVLALGFALLTLGATIAVVALHLMALAEANKVLEERLEKATMSASAGAP